MRARICTLLALASLPLAGASCGTRDPGAERVSTTRSALEGAPLDLQTASVVGVVNNGLLTACSGTLLAPNLVLTTRHCVDGLPQSLDCSMGAFQALAQDTDISVASCSDIHLLGKSSCDWHSSAKIYRPSTNEICGADITLIRLKDPILRVTAAVPSIDGAAPDGPNGVRTLSLFGFGAVDAKVDGWGYRRRRDNVAVACWGTAADCSTPSISLSPLEFKTDDGVCQGDSGGAAGTVDAAGLLHVVGVIARGGVEGNDCRIGVYTRLDSWRDLIVDAAIEAATVGGYARPAWAKPAPKAIGIACSVSDECASLQCANGICTHSCQLGGPSTCEDGLVCSGGVCTMPLPTGDGAASDAPAETGPPAYVHRSGGCSVRGSIVYDSPIDVLVIAGVAAAARFRRRRVRDT